MSVFNCIINYPTHPYLSVRCTLAIWTAFLMRGNEKKLHGDSKRHTKWWGSKLRAKSKGTRDALPRDATSPTSTSFARFYLNALQAHKADSNLIEGSWENVTWKKQSARLHFSESFLLEWSRARSTIGKNRELIDDFRRIVRAARKTRVVLQQHPRVILIPCSTVLIAAAQRKIVC